MPDTFAPILDFIAGRSAEAITRVNDPADLAAAGAALVETAKDVPPLLATVRRVLDLAAEFDTEDGHVPEPALTRPVSRGDKIRAEVLAGLLGEESV